jgi:hypothetical protein
MNQSRKCTATKFAAQGVLLFALWAMAALALAGPVAGKVVHLSGPLFAKKANGVVKALSVKSEVESGDTLVTEKNTYAMVRFIDNSEITLKPGSTMTVEDFSFDNDKQEGDKASFKLVKGGLRSVTGLLGKRSKEKFELKTPSATIGIRGTTFIAEYVEEDQEQKLAAARAFLLASTAALPVASDAGPIAPPVLLAQANFPVPGKVAGAREAPSPLSRAPGLYVQVLDGMIHVANPGGIQTFNAGQFGYVPSMTVPPIVVPQNPGLKFTPPPVFNSSTGGPSGDGKPDSTGNVDCVVR